MHVQIITAKNAHQHGDLLEQTFRLRHEVLVEERGWRALARADGREIDRFDDAHATYVLVVDDGRVVAGDRLHSTMTPHLMSEVFAPLLHRALPVGAEILEVTRHVVAKHRRCGRAETLLIAGVTDFCVTRGVRSLTAVAETWWLPRLQQAGFVTRPLGLPVEMDEQHLLAVEIEIAPALHRRARAGRSFRTAAVPRPLIH